MTIDRAALLQTIIDNQTFLIQRARLMQRPPSEIALLVAAGDYLDDMDPNDPNLTSRLQFVADSLSHLHSDDDNTQD